MQSLGIDEVSTEQCQKLVGVGTDSAASNIAAFGLKGLVEGRLGWIFCMWCLAHRLELAIKDALQGTCFDLVTRYFSGCTIFMRSHLKSPGSLKTSLVSSKIVCALTMPESSQFVLLGRDGLHISSVL